MTRIAAIRLACTDIAATAAFLRAAFGCVDAPGGLILGAQRIELAQAARRGPPAPSASTAFQHFCIVVRDMDAAMAHLDAVPGWQAISRAGPERLPDAAGGVTAFKFRDPEGHPLELLQFPTDAIPDAWREGTALFAGIDHTAIAVTDTRASVAFYARLGFEVVSRNVNSGPEQARMDDADGAEVEVTGLAIPGAPPPHLELLRYRRPAMRTEPVPDDDSRATVVVLGDVEAGADPVSRDPNGHRLAAQAG